MFNTLSKMFSGLFDLNYAPAEAVEFEPVGVSAGHVDHFATDMEVSWTNGFGTLNDFEVPASSCQDDLFSEWP